MKFNPIGLKINYNDGCEGGGEGEIVKRAIPINNTYYNNYILEDCLKGHDKEFFLVKVKKVFGRSVEIHYIIVWPYFHFWDGNLEIQWRLEHNFTPKSEDEITYKNADLEGFKYE